MGEVTHGREGSTQLVNNGVEITESLQITICPGLSSGREQRRTHERFVLVGRGGIDLVRVRVWGQCVSGQGQCQGQWSGSGPGLGLGIDGGIDECA